MNRVAIYVRVSTNEQAAEGYSIAEQTERCRKYCEAMKYTVARIYTDPGFSGASLDRPAMQQMIEDAKEGRFDTVLVYKFDRLSRSQKDTLYLIEDVLLAHNVSFISMSENFDTSSPFGRAMIGILSVFAQLEREQIKERMEMGRIGAAKEGRWRGGSGVPIGYTYTAGDEGILKIDPYEAMQIKELYDLWLQGISTNEICKRFRAKGYTTKYGGWSYAGSIPSIITNPVYIGMQRYDGKVFPGLQEPIITQEVYDAAVADLERRRSQMSDNQRIAWRGKSLLSGLIFCGQCGARYFVSTCVRTNRQTHEKKTYRYYICYSRDGNSSMKKSDNCTNKRWGKEELEHVVLDQILKMSYDVDKIKPRKPKTDGQKAIASRIKVIDKQISSLLDLYQVGGIPIDQIGTRVKALTDEKDKLELSTAKETGKPVSLSEARKILSAAPQIIECGSDDDRRFLVSKLISKITINGDDIAITWTFT